MDKVKLEKSSKDPEVYAYYLKDSVKRWMYRHKYEDSYGKVKEKKKSGCETEKAAIKALVDVKAQTLRGNTKLIENDYLTISQWLDTWLKMDHTWKPRTREIHETAVRLQLKPLIGHFKLQKLDKDTYQKQCINVLGCDYAYNTVKTVHNTFKTAINAAVEAEIIARNRFLRVALPEEEEKIENFFTPNQLLTFLNDAKQNENITNNTLLLTIAYTGVRLGEACGLQWRNIDFDNNKITIERTRNYAGTGKPKTKNSYRSIQVDKSVIDQLATYKTWCKSLLLSIGKKLNADTFVFLSEQTNEPIHPTNTAAVMLRIVQRANLPKVTIHGLRHTHATILLNDGLPVKVIADRLGNTPRMIHTVYAHVLEEMEQESVAVFSRSLEDARANFRANS
ncbi:tyrosine-type recombinase/integrase [Lysinibacillus sp. NPDC096418]|uniref:tyrosine-type recombinase/integrase n=1 Tax=Lysinibacillus sp. NPDC096418 TaxID=3364138 RepID=UPI00381AC11F